MTIAHINSGGNGQSGNSNASLTVTFGFTATLGNLLVLAVLTRDANDILLTPSGWNLESSSLAPTWTGIQNPRLYVWEKQSAGTETAETVTIDASGVGKMAGLIYELSGADTSDPFDALTPSTVNHDDVIDGDVDLTAITPGQNDSALIGIAITADDLISAVSSATQPFVNHVFANSGGGASDIGMCGGIRIQTTAAAEGSTFTMTGIADVRAGWLHAIKPAVAGGFVPYPRYSMTGGMQDMGA